MDLGWPSCRHREVNVPPIVVVVAVALDPRRGGGWLGGGWPGCGWLGGGWLGGAVIAQPDAALTTNAGVSYYIPLQTCKPKRTR